MSLTFELRAGRLCELRMNEDFAAADMPGFRTKMAGVFRDHPGKLFFCNDLRRPKRFGPEEERQLSDLLRADSPRIGRSAFLVQRGSPLAMQVLRLVTDAENKGRRVFQERRDLELWLGEVLTEDEKVRMRKFLDE